MAEEVNDASRTLPKVIIWAVITNAAMLILVGITYVFCIGNVEQVLNTPTYQPVIQVFYNATRSKAGATVMCVVIIVVFLSACVGQVATASRQMWSFARDGGKSCTRAQEMGSQTDRSQASHSLLGSSKSHQDGISRSTLSWCLLASLRYCH
jgi:amino acid permease